MPSVKRRWTVAERDQLPDDGKRYEVVDGELLVTPAPAWRHQTAVALLLKILMDYLQQEPVAAVLPAPADVVFAEDRGVQPDLFAVPLVDGRVPAHFDEVRRLLLAVEVLSPSSARADRITKRGLYRDERVPEYWVVDLDARAFERTTPDEDRPEILAGQLEWMPEGARKALVIDIPGYFVAVLGSADAG